MQLLSVYPKSHIGSVVIGPEHVIDVENYRLPERWIVSFMFFLFSWLNTSSILFPNYVNYHFIILITMSSFLTTTRIRESPTWRRRRPRSRRYHHHHRHHYHHHHHHYHHYYHHHNHQPGDVEDRILVDLLSLVGGATERQPAATIHLAIFHFHWRFLFLDLYL